ncbi:glycosyltransferase family 9 protein [Propionispora vibrioides]|uniref:Heptosyltransferase-1 n=1 Tax=Propionispora vibrioides TaxID=112903 RepID=A0A1H8S2G7_9FIRM|nr:glycosyltransferase family 9 protein [Propionispora vibrioides]SEO72850.1 heptosyltransferase-1 [Propionispora vibrioides]
MSYRNILIVKLSAIGDVIHALPVAHALKQCYPEARITWVVEKPAYDLLTNNPDIDEIIVFDKPKFKSIGGLLRHGPGFAKELKQHHFDLSIDLQGLFKSGMISWLSGARERLVYCNAREGSDFLGRKVCGPFADGHVVNRYLDVVRSLGCQVDAPVFPIEITEEEAGQALAIAKHSGLDVQNSYVILAIGANWPNKCWPVSRFAELADRLYEDGVIPVVIGGAKETTAFAEMQAIMRIPPVNMIGKTTLKQLAYLIRRSQAFVGGDTGPMHLAAATGAPVVALYGPTDANRNGPFGSGHKAIIIDRDCAGCWQRQCPKSMDCLEQILVVEVYNSLQAILGRKA